MSALDSPRNTPLRTALISSAALIVVIALAGPANAAASQAVKKPNPEKEGFGAPTSGVLQIVVSIGSQRVTLFHDGVPVAQGPVSTGMPGHPTPMGVFSVIQKDRYHHSNIYSGAPMPYMQRITWSGVAMHEGVLPGHPASHGCIRLSHGFAAALWPTTKLGVRVIVARNDLRPVEFQHPNLFTPKLKPADGVVVSENAKPIGLVRVAESTGSSKDVGAVDVSPTESEPVKPAATDVDPPKPAAPRGKLGAQPIKRNGQIAVFVSRKEQKIFVRQGFVPLFDMPVVIDQPERPLGTHVFTVMGTQSDGSGVRWNVISIPTEARKVAEKPHTRSKSKEPVKTPVVEPQAASSPAEALDRIQLPREAVDRIGELLVPGSSLTVSDQGNSGETGQGTDFIILTR